MVSSLGVGPNNSYIYTAFIRRQYQFCEDTRAQDKKKELNGKLIQMTLFTMPV